MIKVKDMAFALYCQTKMGNDSGEDMTGEFEDVERLNVNLSTGRMVLSGVSGIGEKIMKNVFSSDHIIDAIERLQTKSSEFYQAFCESVGDCASMEYEYDSAGWNREADQIRHAANYILLCVWSANEMCLPAVRVEDYLCAMIPRKSSRELAGVIWRKLERQGEDRFGRVGFHFMAIVTEKMESLAEESRIHLLALLWAVLMGLEREKQRRVNL